MKTRVKKTVCAVNYAARSERSKQLEWIHSNITSGGYLKKRVLAKCIIKFSHLFFTVQRIYLTWSAVYFIFSLFAFTPCRLTSGAYFPISFLNSSRVFIFSIIKPTQHWRLRFADVDNILSFYMEKLINEGWGSIRNVQLTEHGWISSGCRHRTIRCRKSLPMFSLTVIFLCSLYSEHSKSE